jgi:hypothetical protein
VRNKVTVAVGPVWPRARLIVKVRMKVNPSHNLGIGLLYAKRRPLVSRRIEARLAGGAERTSCEFLLLPPPAAKRFAQHYLRTPRGNVLAG